MSYLLACFDEDSNIATTKFFAAQDAQRRDRENKPLFSEEEQAAGQALFEKVSTAFFRSRVFRNYRETFIAVKVEKPTKLDLLSNAVHELDAYCRSSNIKVKATKTAIIYHIALKNG
jgi:hypothetical protein